MGSTVSICNCASVILNVALVQVTPIHYQNQVQPNSCVTFRVGRVWFTVEATTWMYGHEYGLEKDLVRPILDLTFETVQGASNVKDVQSTRDALNRMLDHMSNLTQKVPTGNNGQEIPPTLKDRNSGVFMNRDRYFRVVGGPNATQISIDPYDGSQTIADTWEPFRPIQIVEEKNVNNFRRSCPRLSTL